MVQFILNMISNSANIVLAILISFNVGCSSIGSAIGIPGIRSCTKYGSGSINYLVDMTVSCGNTVQFKDSQPTSFNVRFYNRSNDKIAIIKDVKISSFASSGTSVVVKIIYHDDTIPKYKSSFLVPSNKPLDSNDYIVVNPLEGHNFKFEINFNNLYDDLSKIPGENSVIDSGGNKNYGTYYVWFYYDDPWCRHKWALRNALVSNVLKVNFLEKNKLEN